MNHLNRVIMTLCLLTATLSAAAQDEPEYRMEFGAGAGMAAYEGDFNGNILKGMQPMGGIVTKYKMNPRMAWAGELSYVQLKGNANSANTWYPLPDSLTGKFASHVVSIEGKYEYNFWPFGTGREYRGARPLTPFIAMGLGFAVAGGDGSAVALQMPVGLGVKYKLRPRLNLTAQWLMHFTGTDKLDGHHDPYGIKSSGIFKNTDCFSTLQLQITYEFWERCKTCHNDRD